MKEIDLRRVDLNLLILFDTLMTERSVTRTADRLGRTQSAISHSLNRLREQLGDPLLVKRGGRMVASPYAERLVQDVRPILATIRRVLAPADRFDPATATRLFRVALPDLNDALFPRLAERIRMLAPAATLEWVLRDEAVLTAVADGLVDLALVPAVTKLPDGIAFANGPEFRWASFIRRKHPAIRHWNRTAWTRWPHVAVRVGAHVPSPVDAATSAFDERRHVAIRVPHFSAVAPLLARTDLVATLPMIVMYDRLRLFGLVALRTPVPVLPMPHRIIWSRRLDGDAGLQWLRGQLTEVLDDISQAADAAMPA